MDLHRAHPDVLKADNWESAFGIAEGLTRLLPDELEPLIWRSDSVRLMNGGGVLHAFELLHDALNDFPDEPIVRFNLACYCSQLGRMTQAQSLAAHRGSSRTEERHGAALETEGARRERFGAATRSERDGMKRNGGLRIVSKKQPANSGRGL